MSEYDLPELPSDEDLGIDDEDLEEFAEDEGSELSDQEMAALLGDDPTQKGAGAGAPQAMEKAEPASKPEGGTKGLLGLKRVFRKRRIRRAAPPRSATPARPARGAEDEGPSSRWRGPATLAALLVMAWLSSSARVPPRPVPANAPDTTFSSARAMAHLMQIARKAHPPGSPEHARVRSYVIDRLRDLDLEPTVQTATSVRSRGSYHRAAVVRNVVARFPGTESTGAVVLTAHYDGREGSLAAGDDGLGVVAILESARALLAGPRLKNDLIVLVTDAEELGLLGARAFVDEHPWLDAVRVVISVEMRGSAGPSVMFETGAENGWILQALRSGHPAAHANSLSYEVYKRLPNDTDFTPFKEAGKQGLNFAGLGRANVYHQVYDSPANLSEATLQHAGVNVLSMARYLGNADLSAVEAADVVYFSLPFLGLVVYPRSWILPLSGVLLLTTVLVLVLGRRGGSRPSGMGVGFGAALVVSGVAAAAGWGLFRWLLRFHPELDALHGSAFHSEGWYVAALAAVVFAATCSTFGLARRWFSGAELTLGAMLVPVIGALILSFFLPMGAMNLQWPALAAVLGVLVLDLAGDRRSWWVQATQLVLAAPVLAFLVSLVELLWLSLSFAAALPLGVLLAVVFVLLTPVLDGLREPNRWWAPVSGLVFCAACLGMGLLAASPSPERPLHATLLYGLDRAAGEAVWITDALDHPDDSAVRALLEENLGLSFAEERSTEALGYGTGPRPAASAEVVDAPDLLVTLVSDTTVDGMRRVRAAVRSQVGAELLLFRFPDDGPGRLTGLNGRALPGEERPTRVDHWGEPDGAVVLDLELPAGEVLTLDVVEHLLRPEELLGDRAFQLPAHMAPNIRSASHRALLRTVFGGLDASADGAGPAAAGSAGGDTSAGVAAAPGDSVAARPDTASRQTDSEPDTVPSGS